ncbi:MAG: TetR/AcrR family transcriptional regulator [Eubacterium sp.]|nr:TetR/AcrR family transcriptional regulator [Eubacterium sp.]
MIKGNRKKQELQSALKTLAIEKGYANVTMKDIGEYVGLSVGGLYHHYHSVNEIFNDLLHSETENVWSAFQNINTFDELMMYFDEYLKTEKKELLSEEISLNTLLYQYYFSFPEDKRQIMMKASHDETISHMVQILIPIIKKKSVCIEISEHIYMVLNGLVVLSFSNSISKKIIDAEFDMLKNYMIEKYSNIGSKND